MLSALRQILESPRLRPAWRGVLAALLVVISWLAFRSDTEGTGLLHGDKINHLLAFGTLTVIACACVEQGRRSAMWVVIGLIGYGAFIEIVQTQIPSRQGDWADLAADMVGVALGLAIVAAVRRVRQ